MSIVPRPHETTHKVWQRNAFLQPWRRWKDCEHKFKSETHTFQACCTKCWTMSVWKYPTKSEPNWSENASKIAPPYSDISPKPETSAECPLTDYRAVATNQQQNLANADQKYCTFTLKSVTLPIAVHGQFCKPYSVAHVKHGWTVAHLTMCVGRDCGNVFLHCCRPPWWAFILTWATEDRVCIWTLLKQLLLDAHFCKPCGAYAAYVICPYCCWTRLIVNPSVADYWLLSTNDDKSVSSSSMRRGGTAMHHPWRARNGRHASLACQKPGSM